MNLHSTQTEFNCGIDLHTRNMYVCVMNRAGDVLLHRKVRNNDMDYLRSIITPWIDDLSICCESTCNWYILQEFCMTNKIEFVLGHAPYIKAISQSKKKNDRQDSLMLANLLRTKLLPKGYALAPEFRETRDLLRRRNKLVRVRSMLKSSLTMSTHAYGYKVLSRQDKKASNRRDEMCKRAEDDKLVLEGFEAYLEVIDALDEQSDGLLKKIEKHCLTIGMGRQYEIIRSFPGIGPLNALTILFEIGDLNRFSSAKDLLSYSRIVKPQGESDGKPTGKRKGKSGNPHLSWAFNQVMIHGRRTNKMVTKHFEALERKHGPKKARNILAAKYARSIYSALKNNQLFNLEKFLNIPATEESLMG